MCDWWYNVDCSQSVHFYDYSNARLYQGRDVALLDNQDIVTISELVEDDLPSTKPVAAIGKSSRSAASAVLRRQPKMMPAVEDPTPLEVEQFFWTLNREPARNTELSTQMKSMTK